MLTRLAPVGAAFGAIAGLAVVPLATVMLGALAGVGASVGVLVWRWVR